MNSFFNFFPPSDLELRLFSVSWSNSCGLRQYVLRDLQENWGQHTFCMWYAEECTHVLRYPCTAALQTSIHGTEQKQRIICHHTVPMRLISTFNTSVSMARNLDSSSWHTNYDPTEGCHHNQDMITHEMKLWHAMLSLLRYAITAITKHETNTLFIRDARVRVRVITKKRNST
jgi:hypothetical protein